MRIFVESLDFTKDSQANGWVSLAILTAGLVCPNVWEFGDLSIAFRRKVEGDDDEEEEVRVMCVELRRKMGFYLYSSIIRHGT